MTTVQITISDALAKEAVAEGLFETGSCSLSSLPLSAR
jgi:hypothetical protein